MLRAERWWDKLGKASGLAREFQLLSDEFNESVYVASDDEGFKKLIWDASFRNIVTSLIESRLSRVRISQGYHSGELEWKTKAYFEFWKRLTSRLFLEKVFSSLIDLKDHLKKEEDLINPSGVPRSSETRDSSKLITGIGYGLPVASIILGGLLFFWGTYYPTFTEQLFLTGFKAAAVALVLYLPIGYYCFRGGSKAHKEFLGFSLCALVGLPVFAIGFLTTANGFMDESTAVWHKGQPTDLHYDEGDYYVTVETIHEGIKGDPELQITEQIYNQLKKRNEVMVKVRDGYLSELWVEDVKLTR